MSCADHLVYDRCLHRGLVVNQWWLVPLSTKQKWKRYYYFSISTNNKKHWNVRINGFTNKIDLSARLMLGDNRDMYRKKKSPLWHKSSKCNISISNGLIVFKFYTEVKYLKLHQKLSMTRLTPKLHSLMTVVSPKYLKCNISMNNGPLALKFCTEVQSQ